MVSDIVMMIMMGLLGILSSITIYTILPEEILWRKNLDIFVSNAILLLKRLKNFVIMVAKKIIKLKW